MADANNRYPNLTWAQFSVCNDNVTGAFEDMSRRLFSLEFLGVDPPHSDHNNPGVEVLPILEAPHADGSKQRKISFQAKYFESNLSYTKIKDSMNQAIKHYKDDLDLIYLFCNKTLTTTAQGYKEIKALLEKADIELYPISNNEVLDLVSKHRDIANYFFMPRTRPGDAQHEAMHTGIVISPEYNSSCPLYPARNATQIIDPRLLQSLVQEKIQICKSYLLEMQIDQLREELDKIFAYQLNGITGAETLYFYRLLMEIHDGKAIDTAEISIPEQYNNDLLWAEEYHKKPVSLGAYSFASHSTESQTIVLDKMFAAQLWNAVVDLCKEIISDNESEFTDTAKKYYGLALFNLQKYSEATDLLKGLYQRSRKDNILLYSIFAETKKLNLEWHEGHFEHRDRLTELIEQLDALKEHKQYKGNKNLVAMTYLETAYNLGVNEKKFLEAAIERYHSFDEDVQNDGMVKYLYGLCLELNGNVEDAEVIYSELDWKNDASISCRYLICKLIKGKYDEAIKAYNEGGASFVNTKLKSLYLTALYYENRDVYETELKDSLSELHDNFDGILDIAFGIHEKTYLKDQVVPIIKEHLEAGIESLEYQQKTELLSILSHASEIELISKVIKNITPLSSLNRYIVKEIYDAVFVVSNKEFSRHNNALIQSEELDASEKIADVFLEAGVSRIEFLQIKYLCAGAKEKRFSMLKYAKELFEITNDEGLARNIIAMLFERNETDFNAYIPYIDVLRNSANPDYCMAVASAMLRLGKIEEADLYAYKALYYLSDTDNYEIYKNYFAYYNQNLNRYHDEGQITRVKANTVVTLEENLPDNEQSQRSLTLCLDSESEFSDANNMCMGVKHIIAGTPLYIKLLGSSLNQVLKIDDVSYRLINIQSRTSFAAGFIFRKIGEDPQKFGGSVLVLSSDNPEEMIDKIKSMTGKNEQTEVLLNLYHFKENDIGLPIDSFVSGDYDRYVDALTMLLYEKDQAFYTGYPTYEDEENQSYIPALSTLVLLSAMNILNVLDGVKDSLIIPKSYEDFFAERYNKAKETNIVSPGKLVNVNNQLMMVDNSTAQVELWEKIIDFCIGCKKIEITDEERIDFSVGEDINGEQFIAAVGLHLIHLDAFVLAKKENATLLCDDLFFRKLATAGKIRNINFVSLLHRYVDKDFVVPIVIELSKTNYLYIPLMARTDEEAVELKKNILDGELKKKYYSDMLVAYNAAWKNVMRELFGDSIEFEDEQQ